MRGNPGQPRHCPKDGRSIMAMRLVDLRLVKGWTQKELSRVSGVNASTISAIEKCRYNCRDGTLQCLADALDVPIGYLKVGSDSLPWKTVRDPRGRIYCPYCGKGNGWTIRDLEANALPKPKYCGWCGREVSG